ncbi:cobalamin-binding isoform A [Micractinium conductrix]|uniref:Cobalamin-binding isoform A n=1 Tax=Micractinium conductrix TaxID=554055 RepID=A0A2P6V9F9_9CHLO|nr:cobalamin-binding isoform A [Micractinium conductrix]|eukprot:PSC70726.1 cobalamin-binding isoform A [Micractinium conductrix]
MSASAAAVREMSHLGAALAVPLLEYGLSVYHLNTELLRELRPDVVLTCMQTAHGAMLEGQLMDAALHAVLGYAPRVVHCEAQDLDGVWADEQAVADALDAGEAGRQLVEGQRRQLGVAAEAARGRGSLRVACIQWPQPLMACGAWVPQLVQMTGSQDVCGAVDHAEVLTPEQLEAARPDVVVFALCGLTLEQSARAAAAAARRLGDAWRRLPASLEALVELLHPEAQPFGHEGKLWRWLPAASSA